MKKFTPTIQDYPINFEKVMSWGNPTDNLGWSVAHKMAQKGFMFTFDELLQLRNPVDVWGNTPASLMAEHGFQFTCDQILLLGDHREGNPRTISHYMARNGHLFTFEEIIRLKNPADQFRATLAHWSARNGFRFSLDELFHLGNSVITYSDDDLIVSDGYFENILIEEVEYQHKEELLHKGATIAHIMARESHRFTADEILRLGNPIDAAGRTIADWMTKVGNPLPDEYFEKINKKND